MTDDLRAVASTSFVRAVGVTFDDHPRYEVTLNGEVIGHVEGNNPTFERSSRGRRYVNSRWRSKRRYWRVIGADGRTILHDVVTRKRAVELLVSFCPNVPALAQSGGEKTKPKESNS